MDSTVLEVTLGVIFAIPFLYMAYRTLLVFLPWILMGMGLAAGFWLFHFIF